jgi:hypothetical protein
VKHTRLFATVLAGVAVAAAACTTDELPTGVTAAQGPSARAALSASQKDSVEATNAARKTAHELLRARRDSLRAAYKRRKEESRAAYEAAKRDWDAYKREWADYKKDHKDAKIELLRCEPQEFTADAEVIGPAGGQLKIGAHTLVIPKGALDGEQLIAGESPTSPLVEVSFQPHGLQFARSAQLTLSYEHCMRPNKSTYRIVYAEDEFGGGLRALSGTRVLEFPPSKDDKTLKKVQADIDHFSRYMIAY